MTEAENTLPKLTPKQELFCQWYVKNGFNGTKAAIAAGYSEKTAFVIASENLIKPNIKARIEQLRSNETRMIEEMCGVSKPMIISKHLDIVNNSIAHLHDTWITRKDFEALTDEQKSCISEISTSIRKVTVNEAPVEVEYVKIKLYDRQKSLDSINKMLGYDAPIKLDESIKLTAQITGMKIVPDGTDAKATE